MTRKETKMASEPIAVAYKNIKTPVMAIDQALDGTGVAFIFPRSLDQHIESFIQKSLPFFDDRYSELASQLKETFKAVCSNNGGPLYINPENSRKKPFSFGFVTSHEESAISVAILHGRLGFEASDTPEWQQVRMISKMLLKLAKDFKNTCQLLGFKDYSIVLEGLALHGSTPSISILPCLGLLYGRIWEELMSEESIADHVRELPISTWKKAFSGRSKLKKAETKAILYELGFERIGSDDESDAVAMAISASINSEILKLTRGRMRPTKDASAKSRAKREGIKLRREAKKLLDKENSLKSKAIKPKKKKKAA